MAAPAGHGLSKRGWSNVEAIMPSIKEAVEQGRINKNTNIDLATAESWLIRSELVDLCKSAVVRELEATHFSYPRGYSGDPDLLDAYAAFFNKYFAPRVRVLPSHLSTAAGASACIDALMYNICEAGDGVLIPSPYWRGFDYSLRLRSSVCPVLVPLPSLGANFSPEELLPALEEAYRSAPCPIRALLITNPHNPLAVCYPGAVLELCLRFCKKYGIHFISDEVYALSTFSSSDLVDPQPFISVLSLDLDEIGADKTRTHMIWSMSKDFGQSGFRMGCTVTQFNEEMAVGLALAADKPISALSSLFVTSLLSSPELPSLIALNSERLSAAYTLLTTFFREIGIPYVPCNAGLFVFARLAPKAVTWEDEAATASKLREAGVLVSEGRAYHGPEGEKGWMRVGFAVEEGQLREAVRRMRGVLSVGKPIQQ
ncbi:hypothetical protein VPNG_00941 [Cytospora leucostoma]|uniref:Aminotransferase class I/classII large domain-containing protein n=1 Tax=Cytospora leucostoma TaxID=1230097 RepID=A0A423XLI4_9PEZI|nr:hypothetical protein VPNG_00941 [Cytospora leucostoma]